MRVVSHTDVGSYTDIVISFDRIISQINLSVETYTDDGKLNGIKNIEMNIDSVGYMMEFNNYKTRNLENVNVIVHNWEE